MRLSAMQNLLRVTVDGSEVIVAFEPSPLAAGTFSVSGGGLGADGLTVDAVAVWVMPSAVMTGTPIAEEVQVANVPQIVPTRTVEPPINTKSNFVTSALSCTGSNYRVIARNDAIGLRSAITIANSGCVDTIYLQGGTYLMGSTLVISGANLAIYGNNSIIRASNSGYWIFDIAASGITSFHHVIIENANTTTSSLGYGGAIRSISPFKLYDSTVRNNKAELGGGGLMAWDAVEIYRSTFNNNEAGGGAAIQLEGAGTLIGECLRITDNVGNYAALLRGNMGQSPTFLSGYPGLNIRIQNSKIDQNYANVYADADNVSSQLSRTAIDLTSNWWGLSGGPQVNEYRVTAYPIISPNSDPTITPACASPPPVLPPINPPQTGLWADYYNNMDLTQLAYTTVDQKIDFNWGNGSPSPQIAPDTFSVVWTGQITAQCTGRYKFFAQTDDGFRLIVNGQVLIEGWRDQWTTLNSEIDLQMYSQQPYDIRVEYYENLYGALAKLEWEAPCRPRQIVPSSAFQPIRPSQSGLMAEYYNGTTLSDWRILKIDPSVDFQWSGSPHPATLGTDNFSVFWHGQLQAQYTQTYTFRVNADDGVRLWVDGQLIIDKWQVQNMAYYATMPYTFQAGQWYDIQLEYYENNGFATMQLFWQSASQSLQIIPSIYLRPSQHASPAAEPTAMILAAFLPNPATIPQCLTSSRLRSIALANNIIANGQPTLTQNRLVGRAFQEFVMRNILIPENIVPLFSQYRQINTFNPPILNVVPDMLRQVQVYGVGGGPSAIYPQSSLWEVKATRSVLYLSYSRHQIGGLIDAAARSPLGTADLIGIPPVMTFVTTCDARIPESTVLFANQNRVALWQAYVFEIPNTSDPNLVVGPVIPLNRLPHGRSLPIPTIYTIAPGALSTPLGASPIGDPDPAQLGP
jgi:hypothetical protein